MLHNPQEALQILSVFGRAIPVILLTGYLAWFYPFADLVDRSGTPLGSDYVMLYVAGQTVLTGQADSLYDDRANQRRTSALLPTMDPELKWPYRYPPVTAWLMSSLAQLAYGWSFATFACITSLCVLLALGMLITALGVAENRRKLVFWSMLGWPVIYEAVIGGQTSPLALFFVVAGVIALQRKHDFIGGLLIGLCIYKPNIVFILVIATLIARPKAFWGMLAVAIPATMLSLHTVGMSGLRTYVELSTSLATSQWTLETPHWKVHGLAPLLDKVFSGHGKLLVVMIGVPVAVALGWIWRKSENDRWWLASAALLNTNALLNPYVPIYDLLLIIPAGLITVLYYVRKHEDHLSEVTPQIIAIVSVLFVGPHLSQSVAYATGVQVFPVLLTMILILQIRELISTAEPKAEVDLQQG